VIIDRAIGAVRAGQVIGVPTDTVYGVGADPLNPGAMEKLFALKGRPDHKPVGLLVASIEQARQVGEIEGSAAELAQRHWPGALTLVVTPKVILSEWVGDQQTKTVGIRVPAHPLLLELLSVTGPLAVTSANLTGEPETMSDVEARAVFGDAIPVYLPGTAPGGEASTVVDVTGDRPIVVRQGPVFL
jgi:tRNA threonylcarbamoyl adenosine modification protein (Sua5/YciO/YrdC/YwlC family)